MCFWNKLYGSWCCWWYLLLLLLYFRVDLYCARSADISPEADIVVLFIVAVFVVVMDVVLSTTSRFCWLIKDQFCSHRNPTCSLVYSLLTDRSVFLQQILFHTFTNHLEPHRVSFSQIDFKLQWPTGSVLPFEGELCQRRPTFGQSPPSTPLPGVAILYFPVCI